MGFFKKLFTGIGFAAGFLFFGCLSVIVYASRGRHKPCHRRSSFWNTLERYLFFRGSVMVCAAAGNERRRPIISAPAAISGRCGHRLDRQVSRILLLK